MIGSAYTVSRGEVVLGEPDRVVTELLGQARLGQRLLYGAGVAGTARTGDVIGEMAELHHRLKTKLAPPGGRQPGCLAEDPRQEPNRIGAKL